MSQTDKERWKQLYESESAYVGRRMEFLQNSQDRVEIIRQALEDPVERGTALRVCKYLTEDERKKLFDSLLWVASWFHANTVSARQVILTLLSEWLKRHIEESTERLLQNGSAEEYRRMLELYHNIDPDITYRLATRALQNDDDEIKEAGKDFMGIMSNPWHVSKRC